MTGLIKIYRAHFVCRREILRKSIPGKKLLEGWEYNSASVNLRYIGLHG